MQSECGGLLRPKWLVDLIGIDYLSHVNEVVLITVQPMPI